MVTETTNVKPLLRFLCERLYLSVPHELFDRYLWLYHDLEEVQHKTVYGGRSDQPRFVVAQTKGTVRSRHKINASTSPEKCVYCGRDNRSEYSISFPAIGLDA